MSETRPSPDKAMAEIKAAIQFYEARGWDWLSVVAFLSGQACGTLPADVLRAWRLPKGLSR